MIDLHTHTSHSDGQQTVAELLQKAERHGLEFLSITDHDTVDAYAELKDPNIRNLFSGTIVNGIEIVFTHNGEQNELLGYGIDIDKMSKIFTAEKKFENESYFIRGWHAVYTNVLGIKLTDIEEMLKILKETNTGRLQIIKQSESAENLEIVREKFGIKNADELKKWGLKEIISPNGRYYVPRAKNLPSLEEASKIIHDAGGLVFMAHIFRVGEKAIDVLDYAMKNKLIDGIEVYYRDSSAAHTKEQIAFLEQYAQKHNLLMSGGSDCHRLLNSLSTISSEQIKFITEQNINQDGAFV